MAYVLIVDDNEDFTTAVMVALEETGHQVATEANPEVVIEIMEARLPDLLILDVGFPEDEFAGFSLARDVRKNFRDLPVIMLTGVNTKHPYAFGNNDIDNYYLPVDDFLEKPVDFNELCKRVDALLNEKNHSQK